MQRDVGFVGDARVAVQELVDENELVEQPVGIERPRLHLAAREDVAHGVVDVHRAAETHEGLAAVGLPTAFVGRLVGIETIRHEQSVGVLERARIHVGGGVGIDHQPQPALEVFARVVGGAPVVGVVVGREHVGQVAIHRRGGVVHEIDTRRVVARARFVMLGFEGHRAAHHAKLGLRGEARHEIVALGPNAVAARVPRDQRAQRHVGVAGVARECGAQLAASVAEVVGVLVHPLPILIVIEAHEPVGVAAARVGGEHGAEQSQRVGVEALREVGRRQLHRHLDVVGVACVSALQYALRQEAALDGVAVAVQATQLACGHRVDAVTRARGFERGRRRRRVGLGVTRFRLGGGRRHVARGGRARKKARDPEERDEARSVGTMRRHGLELDAVFAG